MDVDASQREITSHGEKLKMTEKFGIQNVEQRGTFAPKQSPSIDIIREAIHKIRDPEHRLLHELFWVWPAANTRASSDEAIGLLKKGETDKAERLWLASLNGSAVNDVALHNLAVLAHLGALELEHKNMSKQLSLKESSDMDSKWKQSFKYWAKLYERKSFWALIEKRISDMRDPRLGPAHAEQIRSSLPTAILLINIRLVIVYAEGDNDVASERQKSLIEESEFADEFYDAAVLHSIDPIKNRITILCQNVNNDLDKGSKAADELFEDLLNHSDESLSLLDTLLHPGHPIRDASYDKVALQARTCLIQFGNSSKQWSKTKECLERARELAATESTKSRIGEDLAIVEKNSAGEAIEPLVSLCDGILKEVENEPNWSLIPEKRLDDLENKGLPILEGIEEKYGRDSESYNLGSLYYCGALRTIAAKYMAGSDTSSKQLKKALELLQIAKNLCANAELLNRLDEDIGTISEALKRVNSNRINTAVSWIAIIFIWGLIQTCLQSSKSSDTNSTSTTSVETPRHQSVESRSQRSDNAAALKSEINADIEKQKRWYDQLSRDAAEYDDNVSTIKKLRGDYERGLDVNAYDELVRETEELRKKYNADVAKYKTFLESTKAKIQAYNVMIGAK